MSPFSDRGSGRTTRQMQEAPFAVYYYVRRGELSHARHLARHLQREDLIIREIDDRSELFDLRGAIRQVIVDHACSLTRRQAEIIDRVNSRTIKEHIAPDP